MQRLVVAAVLLGGCDAGDAAEGESGSESTGIVPSDETFGEESSTDDGTAPEYADGEMFGFCEVHADCEGFDSNYYDTVLCLGGTCVEYFQGEAGWTIGTEAAPCTHPDAVPIKGQHPLGAVTGVTPPYDSMNDTTCGLSARVIDGLGHCPDGMNVISWMGGTVSYDGETFDLPPTVSCWWSDTLVSGPRCLGEYSCGSCEAQPYPDNDKFLPWVCR